MKKNIKHRAGKIINKHNNATKNRHREQATIKKTKPININRQRTKTFKPPNVNILHPVLAF